MRLLDPVWLHALWGALALGALLVISVFARRRALRRFAQPSLLPILAGGFSAARLLWKHALLTLALALVVFTLARPAWGEKDRAVVRSGRDVVFVLDVSRSMLAEDLAPSRLERAKLAIRDALQVVRGDRVGLVAFAGTSTVRCPLTLDYGFFRLALEEVNPGSVARGGTMIGDAIRTVLEQVFHDEVEGRLRDIILITDGEDQGSFPLEAAQAAGEAGVRIIAIGLGSADGAQIPSESSRGRQGVVTYQGEPVRSSLDAETLAAVAQASDNGVFLHVGTSDFALDDIYRELVTTAEGRELGESSSVQYEERFQWFLLAAFALLTLDILIRENRRAPDLA